MEDNLTIMSQEDANDPNAETIDVVIKEEVEEEPITSSSKEDVKIITAQPIAEITETDNIIINNFIQTVNNFDIMASIDESYEEVVNKYLQKFIDESFITSFEEDQKTGGYIFTYNFSTIILKIRRLKDIVNQYGDELDILKTSRYTRSRFNNKKSSYR